MKREKEIQKSVRVCYLICPFVHKLVEKCVCGMNDLKIQIKINLFIRLGVCGGVVLYEYCNLLC